MSLSIKLLRPAHPNLPSTVLVSYSIKAATQKLKDSSGILFNRKQFIGIKRENVYDNGAPSACVRITDLTLGRMEEELLERTEKRILREVAGAAFKDRKTTDSIGIPVWRVGITDKMRESSIRWFRD